MVSMLFCPNQMHHCAFSEFRLRSANSRFCNRLVIRTSYRDLLQATGVGQGCPSPYKSCVVLMLLPLWRFVQVQDCFSIFHSLLFSDSPGQWNAPELFHNPRAAGCEQEMAMMSVARSCFVIFGFPNFYFLFCFLIALANEFTPRPGLWPRPVLDGFGGGWQQSVGTRGGFRPVQGWCSAS